ncbi:MAG: hypothetical protein K9J06_08615 [Flavobacteriales bacterium]|nr:hypothetical protein [Flavobacteriales bacterium]
MSLGKRERVTLLSLAAALIPNGGSIDVQVDGAATLAFADRFLQGTPITVRVAVRLQLWFLEYLGWALIPSWPVRFSRSAAQKGMAIVAAVREHRWHLLRGGHRLLALLILPVYYADPLVSDAIGYSS